MKCRSCGKPAQVELPQHNRALCASCYLAWVAEYTGRTIKRFRMIAPGERVLVAVSGGKDSLSLWSLLAEMGYRADGLYIDLGIDHDGYSARSLKRAQALAGSLGRELLVVSLEEETGLTIPRLRGKGARTICSTCGLVKRYYMNLAAYRGGYSCLATGHNLDDEASSLFSNVLNWDERYLSRQSPVSPGRGEKLIRRVKPLVHLTEKEVAQYAFLRGIDWIMEECPQVEGSTFHQYKDALNRLELHSPGTKRRFYDGYLRTGRKHFPAEEPPLRECGVCGMPTTLDTCSFCRLMARG
ncbi:MAG: ATP-binding protein [Spirochaetota bacterium]